MLIEILDMLLYSAGSKVKYCNFGFEHTLHFQSKKET